MAYTTINKSSLNMNTKLYTGTGSSNSVTGVGFKPDWTWIKNRDQADEHNVYDVVRGATKRLITNDSTVEGTQSNGLSAFGSDGFTVVDSNATNISNEKYAAWNWKAGTSFSNSAGANGASIASTGSINTTAGFSIISYTGSGSNATVAHGLGVAPKMIIVKNRQGSNSWRVAHDSIGWNKSIFLDNTNAAQTEAYFNNTAPTSQVFYIGTDGGTNGNNNNIIAYCFADKQGYSKLSSYKGNGNADGTLVYTGFKPAFVIIKRTSSGGDDWVMYDNKRNTFNVLDKRLNPNSNGAEQDTDILDFLSNGFKLRGTPDYVNGNGSTYIYMAFGQTLVGTNNIPANAR